MYTRPIMRKFLVDVLKASNHATDRQVITMIDALTRAGLYAEPTGDEFDAHDKLTDELEAIDWAGLG
jgi:hypothetical protein